MTESMLIYEKQYSIPVYDIGPDGRLAPHALFNYFQDIASEHAVKLNFGKEDLIKMNRFWVLARIEAEIRKWPEWGSSLRVRTWPRGTDRLFALRDFRVELEDGTEVARASSSWLILDITSRRIQKPDSLLTGYKFDTEQASSLGRNAGKLEETGQYNRQSTPFPVTFSDLDVNLHTNNVMYLRWVMDTYPFAFRMSHIPACIIINFISESRVEEEIVVKSKADESNNNIMNHSVFKIPGHAELCRLRVEWKNCPL